MKSSKEILIRFIPIIAMVLILTAMIVVSEIV